MNRKITKYTLKKASEHIYYEIWMFFVILDMLSNKRNKSTVENNILLDAFAIHTRNLFDFFYPKSSFKKDDILFSDYIKNITLYKKRVIRKRELIYIVRKADKQVAHLTYSRNRYTKHTKPWRFLEIGSILFVAVKVFYDLLPPKYKILENFSRLKVVLDGNNHLSNSRSYKVIKSQTPRLYKLKL